MKPFLLTLALTTAAITTGHSRELPAVREAKAVIERFSGNKTDVQLKLIDKTDGKDRYQITVRNGQAEIKGSSSVALCRGYYDWVKSQGAGIYGWSGQRLELPDTPADQPMREVVSPVEHHYYFNVVTYGYSMPYWDWDRWEREIDWMALHGIDMPLALVANEAISARVWKKLGLSDDEINVYFVGPAHLPWMRMGNISGLDNPLPESWHTTQVELQHKILGRMRALGMKPICPAFAGFVPEAIRNHYPEAKLTETHWGGAFRNWMLDPEQELFSRIGRMFIEEWEAEFGPCEYYIADSFNEMEIPFPPKGTPERYSLLASYGDKVYQAIKAGNPNAVWVMQGWMFGYQRHIWDCETLAALLSKVPDDKMLLLDLAVDYNVHFWHSTPNWEFYKGFFHKPWVYSVIPNMGGKTGLTGVLEFYANGHLAALRSTNRGRLTAIGMAPEGIENNEVIYELMADASWSNDSIHLREWLHNYSLNRYGHCPATVDSAWNGLLQSVYGTFTDHPRYNWQFRPGSVSQGTINASADFYRAAERFAEADEISNSPLYQNDLVELTAIYLGGKAELLTRAIDRAYQRHNLDEAQRLEARFTALMLDMDRLLESHPTLRLERWLNYAKAYGTTDSLRHYYEKNARRIITIWGPPVDDYSARIWSGLIRDYYLPRWQHYFASRRSGIPFDFAAWERNWVEQSRGVSSVEPYDNPVEAARQLIHTYRHITADNTTQAMLGTWSAADVNDTTAHTFVWNLPATYLQQLTGIQLQSLEPSTHLKGVKLTLELDGQHIGPVTADANNIFHVTVPAEATGNNICRASITLQSNGAGEAVMLFDE